MTVFGSRFVPVRRVAVFGIVGHALLLGACSPDPASTAARSEADTTRAAATASAPTSKDSPFEVTATLRELMDSTVDPAADGLWESVAYIDYGTHVEDRQPKTDEDWAAVRRHAITLMESMNLVVMEGRHAAPPGTQPGEGELTPEEIDRQIALNRGALMGFAKALRATTQQALTAIDKKDSQALLKAGGAIDDACEACHVTFWYPNQKRPKT